MSTTSKVETADQMIERIRNRMETEPHPVTNLTKMEWAMIVGLLQQAFEMKLTDETDIRWGAAEKLMSSITGGGDWFKKVPPEIGDAIIS